MFVNEARIDYDQKIQLDKHLTFRRDKDHIWVSSLFIKLHVSIQYWKMDGKDIADTSKLVKEFVCCSLVWGGFSSDTQQDYIWLGGDEPDKRSLWGGKMIGKLLLTVTVADPQQLDQKKKLMIYTRAFIEIYNWCYRGLVHETHGIVKLEKYPISRAENPLNLGGQQFYKISEVL